MLLRNHVGVCGPGYQVLSVVCDISRGHVGAHGPAAAKNHVHVHCPVLPPNRQVDVCCLCCQHCQQEPRGSMLLLTVESRRAPFAVVSMTSGSQLRMRDTEGFCDNISPNTNSAMQKQKESTHEAIGKSS